MPHKDGSTPRRRKRRRKGRKQHARRHGTRPAERDLRAEIRGAGADPDKEHEDARIRDGDLDAVQVAERSLGEGWDRAFAHAKACGNTNKAAAVFADNMFEAFADAA